MAARLKSLPEDGSVPGMPGWRWIHTPGHSVGHVSFWRESDRTIIAGDAFVTTDQESAYAVAIQKAQMHGPPMYYTVEWDKAKSSVESLPPWNLTLPSPAMAKPCEVLKCGRRCTPWRATSTA